MEDFCDVVEVLIILERSGCDSYLLRVLDVGYDC